MSDQNQIEILRSVHRLLLAAFALMAAGVGYMIGPRIWQEVTLDRRPPVVEFSATEVFNSPVRAGNNLEVRVYRNKQRDDCRVKASRILMDQDGKVHTIETAPSAEWSGGEASNEYFDIIYVVPSRLPSGDYVLLVDLTYTCPGDLVFHMEQKPARFQVIE